MQTFNFKLASAALLLARLASARLPWVSTQVYSPDTVNGTSDVLFTSSADGLDGPKVRTVNTTSYDWWYFDAVSEDQQFNVVFTFFAAPATGLGIPLDGAPDNAILMASICMSYPEQEISFVGEVPATEAKVVSVGNGASGSWEGTGMGFLGTSDLSNYVVYIDSASLGVQGFMSLQSLAPANYPCGPAEANQTMTIMPGVGWANAVPDAMAQVDLDVNGTSVKFTGLRYHDSKISSLPSQLVCCLYAAKKSPLSENWGVTPFNKNVGSWYWGHGRLGPYSIVWYDALSPNDTESVSGYVARDGKIVGAICSATTVRPTGANSTYPPTIGGDPPRGLRIEVDLGSHGTMVVNATSTFNVESVFGIYYRRTGTLTGGIQGQPLLAGTALWEEFALLPPA
ncbi:hypothetical protein MMC18_001149 [Xylographa bjoerkii]|nr:hypothetical protein [Xylographa bjoerkii]